MSDTKSNDLTAITARLREQSDYAASFDRGARVVALTTALAATEAAAFFAATAKQQDGEVQGDGLLDHLSKYLPSKLLDRVNEALAARQPDESEKAFEDAYARQPVGQAPVMYQERLWHSETWKECTKEHHDKLAASPVRAGKVRALYAAPPAQGIELSPKDRGMLARCLRYCREDAVGDGSAQEIERLLALIDGQCSNAELKCEM